MSLEESKLTWQSQLTENIYIDCHTPIIGARDDTSRQIKPLQSQPGYLTFDIFLSIILPSVVLGGCHMIVRTRIFELYNGRYNNLSELARAMGISVSQIYRVREGKRRINQKFIVGAIKAFPNYNLDDLFYLTPELPDGTSSHPLHLITHPANRTTADNQQKIAIEL